MFNHSSTSQILHYKKATEFENLLCKQGLSIVTVIKCVLLLRVLFNCCFFVNIVYKYIKFVYIVWHLIRNVKGMVISVLCITCKQM